MSFVATLPRAGGVLAVVHRDDATGRAEQLARKPGR